MLADECSSAIEVMHSKMDALGSDICDINHRGKRYFLPKRSVESQRLHAFVFSELLQGVCRELLGNDVWLFLDQFVVKTGSQGMKFGWHQDAGYIWPDNVQPYLSCWIPIDDVSIENGTVYVLPYSRAGGRDVQEHVREDGSNDRVGYFGDDPGVPVVCPAGSLVCFSSHTFHRSGPNLTSAQRRVYLIQYSREILRNRDGSLRIMAEPFLENGRRVVRRPLARAS
jgi:ectoine hydroxylase-related dioxygenase (phytanoyl-CoA dioxygenase family)